MTSPNLHACPDCGAMVSKRDVACPSCGAPMGPSLPTGPQTYDQAYRQDPDDPVAETNADPKRIEPDTVPMEETVYFSEDHNGEGRVQVTSSRVMFPMQVYPMSNIASVRWGKDAPDLTLLRFKIVVGFVAFAACLGLGVAVISVFGVDAFSVVPLILILVTALWALLKIVSAYRALRQAKGSCYLFVGTSGGETKGLSGTDQSFFERLVVAINQAIIDRGGH